MFTCEEDRKAALVNLCCSDAIGPFHGVVRHYIERECPFPTSEYVADEYSAIAAQVEELQVQVLNPRLEIVVVDKSGIEHPDDSPHDILKVTLKNGGRTYVLDLTGAQHGYFEPVIPRESYIQARTCGVIGNGVRFGCMHAFYQTVPERRDTNPYTKVVAKNNLQASDLFAQLIERWETDVQCQVFPKRAMRVEEVLTLSGEGFKRAKTGLVDWLYTVLKKAIAEAPRIQ